MLLAQAAAPAVSTNFGWLVFASVGGLILVAMVILVLILSFGYARRSREMAHSERLKAFECGQALEEPNSPRAKFVHNAFWISFWLVALVPYAAFSAAASATVGDEHSVAFAIAVWICASLAALGAVAGAVVLMLAARSEQSAIAFTVGKPMKPAKEL